MKYKRIHRILLGTVYVILLAFFTWQCLKSGESSSADSSSVARTISSVLEILTGKEFSVDDHFIHLIRKWIGHFGYFVLLGSVSFFFYRTFDDGGKKRLLWNSIHFASGFLFAFISEFVFQTIASGRTASMLDVLLDYGGFLTLSLPVSMLFVLKDRKRHSKERRSGTV